MWDLSGRRWAVLLVHGAHSLRAWTLPPSAQAIMRCRWRVPGAVSHPRTAGILGCAAARSIAPSAFRRGADSALEACSNKPHVLHNHAKSSNRDPLTYTCRRVSVIA